MTHDEMVIVKFLSGSPETFFSRKEIARHAVKRDVYEQNTRWADLPLASLVGQGLVEVNNRGCYRLKEGVFI
jgi:uncharacterized membrane protein